MVYAYAAYDMGVFSQYWSSVGFWFSKWWLSSENIEVHLISNDQSLGHRYELKDTLSLGVLNEGHVATSFGEND